MVGYMLLALAQIMVGITIVSSKYLVASMPNIFLLAIRFLVATIILLIIALITESQSFHCLKQLSKKSWIYIVAQAITAGALFNLLMLWGLNYTSANVAGIITSGLPALIAIIFWLFLKEKLQLKTWLCIGFATAGLAIVSLMGTNEATQSQTSAFGAMIILLALIPEASYYVISKAYVIKLPVFLMSTVINGINAILLLPIMILKIDWQDFHISLFQSVILGIISLTSGLFYVFWYLGADKASNSAASLLTALMPVSTVIIAWLFLGEIITMIQLLGLSLVILSIVICAFSKNDAIKK